jgi:type I restriction enzyme S subunit
MNLSKEMMMLDNWVESSLGDIVDTISKRHKFDKEKIILVNTSDVLLGKVLNHKYVENKNLKGQFKKIFEKDDILFSEIRPKNKRFAYVDFESEDYVASTKLMVLRKKNEQISSQYLYCFLTSEETINKLQTLAESRSGTFPQITYSELARLAISLPPLEEQKAIATTLSCLDDKIELNNRMNQKLEEMAQAIFKSWFVDFEPFQDGEFVDSELGRIPKGWRVAKIETLAKIIRGASPRPIQKFLSKSGMPWLKISDATSSSSKFLFETNQFIIDEGISKSRLVKPGTLILSNSATPGLPMITAITACVHDGWLIFDDFVDISKEYLYYSLKNEREKILMLSNGSVFRNLKTAILKNYKIAVPPIEVMSEVTDLYMTINREIKRNSEETQKLKETRNTLLPKLMSGEVRVPIPEVK